MRKSTCPSSDARASSTPHRLLISPERNAVAPPAVTFMPKEMQFASTNAPSASDPLVFTIRVRADIEIKVFAGHTHALHESGNLAFDTLANSRARPNGIARIGAVWRIAALARIDHPKVSITLNENRIHVFKRQNINAGTAARLGGLRQSDIRAKKERWRTSTRQRTTSRRAASPASKSKHPLSYFLQRWPSACLNGSSIIVGALQNIRHGQLC